MKECRFGFPDYIAPDLARLFPLLINSGFPLFRNCLAWNSRQLQIDLHPEPLRAEIVHKARELYDDPSRVRHEFILRIHDLRDLDMRYYRSENFYAQGTLFVNDLEHTLQLHQFTPLLAVIMSRLQPVYEYAHKKRVFLYHESDLTGDEIAQYETIVDDASRLLNLTARPPVQKVQIVDRKPQESFEVFLDNAQNTLRVVPSMDYGIYRQDISESLYTSRKTKNLEYRPPFDQPGTHIITVENETINCVKVEEEQEKQFYRILCDKSSELGFTKTLKCSRRGRKPLAEYLSSCWPRLTEYAREKGCPIYFDKDELAFDKVDLKVNFSAAVDADNDWLHFDIDCYLDDEHITLATVFDYLERGEQFWRRADGTVVEISKPSWNA